MATESHVAGRTTRNPDDPRPGDAWRADFTNQPDDYMLGYRLYVDSLRTEVSDATISDCANSEQRKGWREAERQEHSDPNDSVANPPWSDEDDA